MISPPPCRVILICTKCKAQILHPMTDSEVVNGMTYFPMIHRFKDSEVVLCAKCEAIYQTQIKEVNPNECALNDKLCTHKGNCSDCPVYQAHVREINKKGETE